MHTRSAYLRRSRKTQRLQKRLVVAAMIGVAASVALLTLVRVPGPLHTAVLDAMDAVPAHAVASQVAAQAGEAAPPARRVYPYSVVPGGVTGGDEVKRMVRSDSVVAAHYAGFDADKATVVTVARPRAVYVSYRKGDKVFWTAGRHTLAAGETLLSDGNSEIRTRCGNRVSDVARQPVEAHGPSERELDTASEAGHDPSLQNVSYAPEAGQGGQSFQLGNYGNAIGTGTVAAAAMRSGPGQAASPDPYALSALVDANRLLAAYGAASAGASGAGGTSGSAAPVASPSPSPSPAAQAPILDGVAISSPVAAGGNTGAPAAPDGAGDATGGTGNSGGTGNTGDAGNTGGTGNTGNTGNTGGADNPAGGSQLPAPVITVPGAQPGGGAQTPSIPEVLLPTQPVATPAKPDAGGGKDNAEVPEPGTLWLGGVAFAALLVSRRRGRRKA